MKCKDCYNEGCLQRAYTADAECVFEQRETQEFDWQSFRNQAAKDILCSMIITPKMSDFTESLCKIAIDYANELIKQLKEKEEK